MGSHAIGRQAKEIQAGLGNCEAEKNATYRFFHRNELKKSFFLIWNDGIRDLDMLPELLWEQVAGYHKSGFCLVFLRFE